MIEKSTERLSICGVSGPGGVGKSYPLRHVLEQVNAPWLGYLTLTVDGSIRDPAAPVFRVRPLLREKVPRYQELRAPGRHREMASALGRGVT